MTDDDELWPSLGPLVVDWIEEYLVHGPGDVAGDRIELDQEFFNFIYHLYEVFPKGHVRAGKRRYKRAFLSRPKGRAKSELAAMVGCAELIAPTRCDGFDAAGDPVGRPLRYREVLSAATEESQAGLTFMVGKYMLENGKAGDAYPLDTGKTRINVEDGSMSRWEPITSGAKSKDGGKSSCILVDESHLWVLPELKALHTTLSRNVVKRRVGDGFLLETSTAPRMGDNSIAETSYKAVESNNDSALFVDHKEAPGGIDIEDLDAVREALIDIYGPASAFVDIDAIVEQEFKAISYDPEKTESDARRYFFNQRVKGETRLVDPILWDLAAADIDVADGTPIVLAFDGSKRRDSTALVAWTVPQVEGEKPHLFKVKVWERPYNAKGYEIPVGDVMNTVAATFDRFKVRLMICDPFGWTSAITQWVDSYGDEVVVEFPTNQPSRMGPAIDGFLEQLYDQGFTHDGDVTITAHLKRAERGAASRGTHSTMNKPAGIDPDTPAAKIDAAVAAVIGLEGLQLVPEEEPTVAMRLEWI